MPEEDAVIRIDADFGPSEESLKDFVDAASKMEVELPVTTRAGTQKPQSERQADSFFKLLSGEVTRLKGKTPDKSTTADPIVELNLLVKMLIRGMEQAVTQMRNLDRRLAEQARPAVRGAEGVLGAVTGGAVIGGAVGVAAGVSAGPGAGPGVDATVAGKELAVQFNRSFSDSFDVASLDQFVTGFESALGDMTIAVVEFTATEIRTTRGLVVALQGATDAFNEAVFTSVTPRGSPVPMTGEGEIDKDMLQNIGALLGNQVKEAMAPLARSIDQMAEATGVSSSMQQQIRALTIQMNNWLLRIHTKIGLDSAELKADMVLETGRVVEGLRLLLNDAKRTNVELAAITQNMRVGMDSIRDGIQDSVTAILEAEKVSVGVLVEIRDILKDEDIEGMSDEINANIVSTNKLLLDIRQILSDGGADGGSESIPDDKPPTPLPSTQDLLDLLGPGASIDIPKPPLQRYKPGEPEPPPEPGPDDLDLTTQRDVVRKLDDTLQMISDAIIQTMQAAGEDLTQFALDMGFASKAMREAAEEFDTAKLKNAFEELARIEIPNDIGKELFEDFRSILEKIGSVLDRPVPSPTFKEGGMSGDADFTIAEDAADVSGFAEVARKALEDEGSQISQFAEKLGEDLEKLDTKIKETIEDLTTINIDIEPEMAPASAVFGAMNDAMELLRTSTLGERDDFIELTNAVWRVVHVLGAFAEDIELKQGMPQGMFENLTTLGIEIERLAVTINNKRDTIEGMLLHSAEELPEPGSGVGFSEQIGPAIEGTERDIAIALRKVVETLNKQAEDIGNSPMANELSNAAMLLNRVSAGLGDLDTQLGTAVGGLTQLFESASVGALTNKESERVLSTVIDALTEIGELFPKVKEAFHEAMDGAGMDAFKGVVPEGLAEPEFSTTRMFLNWFGPMMEEIKGQFNILLDDLTNLGVDVDATGIDDDVTGIRNMRGVDVNSEMVNVFSALASESLNTLEGFERLVKALGDSEDRMSDFAAQMAQADSATDAMFDSLMKLATQLRHASGEVLRFQQDRAEPHLRMEAPPKVDAAEEAENRRVLYEKSADEALKELSALSKQMNDMATEVQNVQFAQLWDDLEADLREGLDIDEFKGVMDKIKDAFFDAADAIENVAEGGEGAAALPGEFDTIKDAIGVLMRQLEVAGGDVGHLLHDTLAPIFDDLTQAVIAMVSAIGDAEDGASDLAREALNAARALQPDIRDVEAAPEDAIRGLQDIGIEPPAEPPPPVAGGAGEFGDDIKRILEDISETVTRMVGLIEYANRQLLNISSDTASIIRQMGFLTGVVDAINDVETAISDIEVSPQIELIAPDVELPDIDFGEIESSIENVVEAVKFIGQDLIDKLDKTDTTAVFLVEKMDAIGAIMIDIRGLIRDISSKETETPVVNVDVGDIKAPTVDFAEPIEAMAEIVAECCDRIVEAVVSTAGVAHADTDEEVVKAIRDLQETVAQGDSDMVDAIGKFASEARSGQAAGREGGAGAGFIAGIFGGGIGAILKRFIPILGAGAALHWAFKQLTQDVDQLSAGYEEAAQRFGKVNATIGIGLAQLQMAKIILDMQVAAILQKEFAEDMAKTAALLLSDEAVRSKVADVRREIMEEEFRRMREGLSRSSITDAKQFGTDFLGGGEIFLKQFYNDDMRSLWIGGLKAGVGDMWSHVSSVWEQAWDEVLEGDLWGILGKVIQGIIETAGALVGTLFVGVLGGLTEGVGSLFNIIGNILGLGVSEDERLLGGRFQSEKSFEELRKKAAGQPPTDEPVFKMLPVPPIEVFKGDRGISAKEMERAVEAGVTKANRNSENIMDNLIPPELDEMFKIEMESTFA